MDIIGIIGISGALIIIILILIYNIISTLKEPGDINKLNKEYQDLTKKIIQLKKTDSYQKLIYQGFFLQLGKMLCNLIFFILFVIIIVIIISLKFSKYI